MEREEALGLLQAGRGGIAEWNRWRRGRSVLPNLKKCRLGQADLRGVDLSGANLRRADLRGADLCGAELAHAALAGADLRDARAGSAGLRQADLTDADLSGADFGGADLRSAVLARAMLVDVELSRANLNGARLCGATCQGVRLAEVNLSAVEGLETVRHLGPSDVAISTLRRSNGRIPERFLKGCGLPDWQVLAARLYTPDLPAGTLADIQARMADLRTRQGIQVLPLFVSHGDGDAELAAALEAVLGAEGLRCWMDRHPAAADPSPVQMERILTLAPMVVVILSEESVGSRWLETEVRMGAELGHTLKRDVIWPAARDAAWKLCAGRDPFRRWFRWCPPLELARWTERDCLRDRMREFVRSRRVVLGAEGEDAASAGADQGRLGSDPVPGCGCG